MKRFKGNSLIEYVLPLGVFFLTGVAVMIVGDVPGRISAFFTDSLEAEMHGTTAKVDSLGKLTPEELELQKQIIAGEVTRIGGEREPLYERVDEVCFASGMCIDIPVITSSATAADTAGGLGGDLTQQFAAVFDQIAEQLEAANMDPTVVSYVTALANGGHDIGDSMETIAEICEVTPCNPSRIEGEIDEFESETYSFKNRLRMLNRYLDAHPDALDAFPEAREVINMEAQQIIAIADGANYDPNTVTTSSTRRTTSTSTVTDSGFTDNGDGTTTGSSGMVYTDSGDGSTFTTGDGSVVSDVTCEGDSCSGTQSTTTTRTSYTTTITSYNIETGDYVQLVDQSADDICERGGNVVECVVNPGQGNGNNN